MVPLESLSYHSESSSSGGTGVSAGSSGSSSSERSSSSSSSASSAVSPSSSSAPATPVTRTSSSRQARPEERPAARAAGDGAGVLPGGFGAVPREEADPFEPAAPLPDAGFFALGRLAAGRAGEALRDRFGAAAFFRAGARRFAVDRFAVDLRLALDDRLRADARGLVLFRPAVFFFREDDREVFRAPPRPPFFAFIATCSPPSRPMSALAGSYNSGFVEASRGGSEKG